jgi:lipopolysaccharide transport system ATP-binding protein
MSTVISVENLSKKYIIGHQKQERHSSIRDALADGAKQFANKLLHPFSTPKSDPTHEEFWALKDVSFDIKQGDRVGIIGRNGAGKSTLLKILSRITEPTSGKISIKGRVSSLLEVGTGFHPELSGRENIFLNGAILGMSKAEIKNKFDEIVAFAEVEKFLDTPVKRYSSGMYVRLAFAVAAHLEPEILIVDEVLAVGDAGFQKKCLGKIEDVGKEGRTVLFVSHNMGMIRALCDQAILLEKGGVICADETNVVVREYFSTGNRTDGHGEISWLGDDAPGGDDLVLRQVRLTGPKGSLQEEFDAGSPIDIEVNYEVKQPVRGMRMIVMLTADDGAIAFASTDESVREKNETAPGHYFSRCTIPPNLLNGGRYALQIHSGIPNVKVLSMGQDYLSMTIIGGTACGTARPEKWPGVVAPRLDWIVGERKYEAV